MSAAPVRRWRRRLGPLMALLLAACSSGPVPVEDRSGWSPAASRAPDHYTVRRGDTLYAIAFRYGLDYRELARWNGIRSPFVIHPGDVLRLDATAPAGQVTRRASAGEGTTVAAAPPPTAVTRPAPRDTQPPPATTASSPPPTSTPTPAPTPAPAPVPATDPDVFAWPTNGRLLRSFRAGDASRNGIDIGGEEGQPVVATAPGVVVYSGNGLIGYGELIIIKHSDRLLSAYAHNRRRLVSEGETVARAQPIAEMGRNERNESALHFEIRVNGRPEDPARWLPSR